MHTTSIVASKEQIVKIKSSMEKKDEKGNAPLVQDIMNNESINLANGIAKVHVNTGESRLLGHANECRTNEIPHYEDSDDDENVSDGDNQKQNPGGDSCGALWDIFRREDVPNLLKYLRKYSNELSQPYVQHVR